MNEKDLELVPLLQESSSEESSAESSDLELNNSDVILTIPSNESDEESENLNNDNSIVLEVSSEQPIAPFDTIPMEIMYIILSFLYLEDLARLSVVNKENNKLIQHYVHPDYEIYITEKGTLDRKKGTTLAEIKALIEMYNLDQTTLSELTQQFESDNRIQNIRNKSSKLSLYLAILAGVVAAGSLGVSLYCRFNDMPFDKQSMQEWKDEAERSKSLNLTELYNSEMALYRKAKDDYETDSLIAKYGQRMSIVSVSIGMVSAAGFAIFNLFSNRTSNAKLDELKEKIKSQSEHQTELRENTSKDITKYFKK